MKKRNKVLPFPAPLEEPSAPTVIFSLGDKRIAIRWEVQELPPAAPLLQWKEAAKTRTARIVEE